MIKFAVQYRAQSRSTELVFYSLQPYNVVHFNVAVAISEGNGGMAGKMGRYALRHHFFNLRYMYRVRCIAYCDALNYNAGI